MNSINNKIDNYLKRIDLFGTDQNNFPQVIINNIEMFIPIDRRYIFYGIVTDGGTCIYFGYRFNTKYSAFFIFRYGINLQCVTQDNGTFHKYDFSKTEF